MIITHRMKHWRAQVISTEPAATTTACSLPRTILAIRSPRHDQAGMLSSIALGGTAYDRRTSSCPIGASTNFISRPASRSNESQSVEPDKDIIGPSVWSMIGYRLPTGSLCTSFLSSTQSTPLDTWCTRPDPTPSGATCAVRPATALLDPSAQAG